MVRNPTSNQNLVDAKGYPYFLWDAPITLEKFQQLMQSEDLNVRAYWIAKLMRQAKPDDVFLFVKLRDIRELWAKILPYLGEKREFWSWLLAQWREF